jgi:hypothetical protein
LFVFVPERSIQFPDLNLRQPFLPLSTLLRRKQILVVLFYFTLFELQLLNLPAQAAEFRQFPLKLCSRHFQPASTCSELRVFALAFFAARS